MDQAQQRPAAARQDQGTSDAPLVSSFAGDPDMAELVDLFVGELSRRVNELQECCAQNDWNSIRRLAHQLKGASAGYGFAPVGIAAGELELRANKALQTHAQADSERAADQLRQLIAICQRVRAA